MKVYIIQRILPHYRIPFVGSLRECLENNDIELTFVYGQSSYKENEKGDTIDLKWGKKIKNIYLPFGLVYQPLSIDLFKADLIIVEQANKLLLNYLLFLLKPIFKYKLAFWGHGWCHQQSKNSFSNTLKTLVMNRVDWWFAYTSNVAKWLSENGVSKDKITAVQNSIDTNELIKYSESIKEEEINSYKNTLGIESGALIGIFCGGMYKEKELPFLIDACRRVKKQIPHFQFIAIGGGPDSKIIEDAAENERWIHYIGPKFGREKVVYLKMANLFLMPGLVGLAILDCFAIGLPLITTEYPYHSPEIAYLENGINGIITKFDKEDFSDNIVQLLTTPAKLKAISIGASQSNNKYSIGKMVENFAQGIYKCLSQ